MLALHIYYANEIYPLKITRFKGMLNAVTKRSLLAFSRNENAAATIDDLVIETARHQYTEEYISITKDFYLKM